METCLNAYCLRLECECNESREIQWNERENRGDFWRFFFQLLSKESPKLAKSIWHSYLIYEVREGNP